MSEQEKLITFGQLIKIKREAMGLNQCEVVRQTGITGLSHYENEKYLPGPFALQQLTGFFKLTITEIEDCLPPCRGVLNKRTRHESFVSKHVRVENMLNVLDALIDDVENMNESGLMAKQLKTNSMDNLAAIKELLTDVLILDKIL